jgi:hypothetical protein
MEGEVWMHYALCYGVFVSFDLVRLNDTWRVTKLKVTGAE